MKIKSLFIGLLAAVVSFSACQNEEQNLGTPDISISDTELTFGVEGGEQVISVTASRDWKVETDADWVGVSPESGAGSTSAQNVTVTVLENTGMDREAELKFTIGMKSKYLTVSQAGPGGSVESLVVYANNFDKTKAEKTGSGDSASWKTYLDDASYDGWRNETGSGIETVTYAAKSLTARTNSANGSGGQHSYYVDLGASGMNYLWFGTAPTYFAIKNITLPEGKKDYTLSFGSERYKYGADDNTYNWDEFGVYISADAKKWVKLSFDFAGGTLPNGKWDLASSTFTLPEGTTALNIYFTSSEGSAYAIDDVKLVQSDKAGTAIDFASGEEFEVGGNIGGSDDVDPSTVETITCAEFIERADQNTTYRLVGKVVSAVNASYCSFDMNDGTATVVVWTVNNKAEWGDVVKQGGTVTVRGKYMLFNNTKHEMVDAYIEKFEPGEGGSDTPVSGKPESLTKATIAEFLAAEESTSVWYELTGEIISIAKADYGNFTIKDATGEVYIYGMTSKWVGSNDKSFSQIGLKVGDKVTLGTLRGSYQGTPQGGGNPVPAYYISHVPGEGGSDNPGTGETPTPPAGGDVYDSELTWTLGANSYDATSSGNSSQKATVNNVEVSNLLKLGKGTDAKAAGGLATIAVPAGTAKIGFYAIGWKGTDVPIRFSVDGTEIAVVTAKANNGATGNPKYTITVTDSDYYTVALPSSEAMNVTVETYDTQNSNHRAILFGLKPLTE